MHDNDDEQMMGFAIEQARAAAAQGDVPVGAVIVLDGKIIASGRNRRELDHDPTAHAEIVALREASQALGHWRIEETLFVTQEPCPMCAGALVNARVKRCLLYTSPSPRDGLLS